MILSSTKKDRTRRAFTLVEVLIALLITSVIGGASVSLLYTYLKNYEQSAEYTAALQRGQMALSVLRPAVLNCAFSIPWNPGEFSSLVSSFDPLGPAKSMKAPLEVDDIGAVKSGDLRILYALPSYFAAADAVEDISESFSLSLLSKSMGLDDLTSLLDVTYDNEWLIFPSAGIPLQIEKKPSGLSLSFKSASGGFNGRIALGDRLFILRYLNAYVDKQPGSSVPSLYVADNVKIAMPQIRGIRRVFFDWDRSSSVLGVWVLSQGDIYLPEPLPQDLNWPAWSGYTITSEDLRYHLAVTHEAWRVRN